jgi:hypothetical protein
VAVPVQVPSRCRTTPADQPVAVSQREPDQAGGAGRARCARDDLSPSSRDVSKRAGWPTRPALRGRVVLAPSVRLRRSPGRHASGASTADPSLMAALGNAVSPTPGRWPIVHPGGGRAGPEPARYQSAPRGSRPADGPVSVADQSPTALHPHRTDLPSRSAGRPEAVDVFQRDPVGPSTIAWWTPTSTRCGHASPPAAGSARRRPTRTRPRQLDRQTRRSRAGRGLSRVDSGQHPEGLRVRATPLEFHSGATASSASARVSTVGSAAARSASPSPRVRGHP